MRRLLSLALALVLSVQVLAASLNPRSSAPAGWESYECFEDNRNWGHPVFSAAGYDDPVGMTIENCANFCDSQPVTYRFMGVTEGSQCSCDNFFEFIYESDGACYMTCPGNPSEICGGVDDGIPIISAYQKPNFSFPATVTSAGLWNGLGCYNDSVSARALQVMVDAGSTTVESCVAACQAQEFSLAGVENGGECWCGSQLENDSKFYYYANGNDFDSDPPYHRQDPNQQFCITSCEGDPTKACGGPALLNLYNFTGTYPIGASVVPTAGEWTSLGCYSDLVSSRTLEQSIEIGSATVELCVSVCQWQMYTMAGLEYGQECWCGHEINSPGAPVSQSACNQACSGSNTEVCGGPDALQLYNFTGTYPTKASVVPTAGEWTSLGCYSDLVSSRTLEQSIEIGGATVETCVNVCQSQMYTMAGLEYGQECWCGHEINSPGAPVSQSACNQACSGDNTEVCGGPDALQLYNFTGTYPLRASVVPTAGEWTSLGCYSDLVSSRTLEQSIEVGSVTVELCVSTCQSQSQMYTMAGLEYGQECWCGHEISSPGAPVSQSACNQACSGDNMEICGGPDALQLYNFTGAYPLEASVVPSAGGWSSRGCYSDLVSSRTLEQSFEVGSVTVESCVSTCQSQSFTIAGLEYAQECWCGNAINSPGTPISQSSCSQACIGNKTEVCGGPDALQLYY